MQSLHKLSLYFVELLLLSTLSAACEQPPAIDDLTGDAADVSTLPFKVKTHTQVSAEALPFLNSETVATLQYWNKYQDIHTGYVETAVRWLLEKLGKTISTQTPGEFHFDQCRIQESMQEIDNLHDYALDNIFVNPEQSKVAFGTLLHTTQDFYSHSNWVESGRTRIVTDAGTFQWPDGSPGSYIDGMIVLGHDTPSSALTVRDPGSYVPRAWTAFGWLQGLMTAGTNDERCPAAEIRLSHDALNKDSSGNAAENAGEVFFWTARDLAAQQSTEEFCRLARRVALRHGRAGTERLVTDWVADEAAFRAACSNNDGVVASVFIAAL